MIKTHHFPSAQSLSLDSCILRSLCDFGRIADFRMKFLTESINLARDLGVKKHLKARAGFVNASHTKIEVKGSFAQSLIPQHALLVTLTRVVHIAFRCNIDKP